METRKRISIYDYPEHLNPFSDKYMSPFAVKYHHKNKTWSSKLSKKLNRSVSWIEKSLFSADGGNERKDDKADNLSIHNYQEGSTCDKKEVIIVSNGNCSPLRGSVKLDSTSDDSIARNENHLRPPVRRRKKRAPLPPNNNSTDNNSLNDDSTNDSITQDNESGNFVVENNRKSKEKLDEKMTNDDTEIHYDGTLDVVIASEVNDNVAAGTSMTITITEMSLNDRKQSEKVEKELNDQIEINSSEVIDQDNSSEEQEVNYFTIQDEFRRVDVATDLIKNADIIADDVTNEANISLINENTTIQVDDIDRQNTIVNRTELNEKEELSAKETWTIKSYLTTERKNSLKIIHTSSSNIQQDYHSKLNNIGSDDNDSDTSDSKHNDNNNNNSNNNNNNHHGKNNNNNSGDIKSEESESTRMKDDTRLVNSSIVISVN